MDISWVHYSTSTEPQWELLMSFSTSSCLFFCCSLCLASLLQIRFFVCLFIFVAKEQGSQTLARRVNPADHLFVWPASYEWFFTSVQGWGKKKNQKKNTDCTACEITPSCQPSIPTGFASADSTKRGLKILGEDFPDRAKKPPLLLRAVIYKA